MSSPLSVSSRPALPFLRPPSLEASSSSLSPLVAGSPASSSSWPYRIFGTIAVEPALVAVEHEYLLAFAESRRWRRAEGPYAVPANPLAECTSPSLDLEAFSTPAPGQPGLHCPWRPAFDGTGLVPHVDSDGGTTVPPSEAAAWLDYLGRHFLSSTGLAASWPECAEFGFDHVLDGAAVVCDVGTGALHLVRVRANAVLIEEI